MSGAKRYDINIDAAARRRARQREAESREVERASEAEAERRRIEKERRREEEHRHQQIVRHRRQTENCYRDVARLSVSSEIANYCAPEEKARILELRQKIQKVQNAAASDDVAKASAASAHAAEYQREAITIADEAKARAAMVAECFEGIAILTKMTCPPQLARRRQHLLNSLEAVTSEIAASDLSTNQKNASCKKARAIRSDIEDFMAVVETARDLEAFLHGIENKPWISQPKIATYRERLRGVGNMAAAEIKSVRTQIRKEVEVTFIAWNSDRTSAAMAVRRELGLAQIERSVEITRLRERYTEIYDRFNEHCPSLVRDFLTTVDTAGIALESGDLAAAEDQCKRANAFAEAMPAEADRRRRAREQEVAAKKTSIEKAQAELENIATEIPHLELSVDVKSRRLRQIDALRREIERVLSTETPNVSGASELASRVDEICATVRSDARMYLLREALMACKKEFGFQWLPESLGHLDCGSEDFELVAELPKGGIIRLRVLAPPNGNISIESENDDGTEECKAFLSLQDILHRTLGRQDVALYVDGVIAEEAWVEDGEDTEERTASPREKSIPLK